MAKQFEENDKKYTQVATLAEGFSFGELALINNKPRAATIRALAPSYFAVLDKESYQFALGAAYKKRLSDRVDFLKSIPIFADWTRNAVEKLTYFFEEKEFKRNHYVFREGDPCDYCYIVMDGEFEASKGVTNEDQHKIEENLLKDFITPLPGKSVNRFETNKLIRRRSVVFQDQIVGLDNTLSPVKQPIDAQFSAVTNKS